MRFQVISMDMGMELVDPTQHTVLFETDDEDEAKNLRHDLMYALHASGWSVRWHPKDKVYGTTALDGRVFSVSVVRVNKKMGAVRV